ncbi:hypothetical protein D5B42_23165 [Salmonella enterica subsp. enterica serovar Oranienburg]|nr:hypothetical protein [Salmonella enterica subsp. enterica serovar Oranienburg]
MSYTKRFINEALLASRSSAIRDKEKRIKNIKTALKSVKDGEAVIELIMLIKETEYEIQQLHESITKLRFV